MTRPPRMTDAEIKAEAARYVAEHHAKAVALTAKIEAKVDELLAPLETAMEIMRWQPEFRAIMWEAIGHTALERARKAAKLCP